jgi:hypothetical protein
MGRNIEISLGLVIGVLGLTAHPEFAPWRVGIGLFFLIHAALRQASERGDGGTCDGIPQGC